MKTSCARRRACCLLLLLLDLIHAWTVPRGDPRHVAFICDGNARWARARGLPARAGHLAGADRALHLLRHLGPSVEVVTLFAFSTENWSRSPEELRGLWSVLMKTVRAVPSREVRVRILGDVRDARLPSDLRDALEKLEKDTRSLPGDLLTVCLAINYGGRQDVLQAARQLVRDGVDPDAITEADIQSRLSTRGLPDPDLIIRTSGERRLSNFLLWNAAYAELYFCDALWPDFDDAEWDRALAWYRGRKRRYGGRIKDDKEGEEPLQISEMRPTTTEHRHKA